MAVVVADVTDGVTRVEFRRIIMSATSALLVGAIVIGGELLAVRTNVVTIAQLHDVQCEMNISLYQGALERRSVEAAAVLPAIEGTLKAQRVAVADRSLARLRRLYLRDACGGQLPLSK